MFVKIIFFLIVEGRVAGRFLAAFFFRVGFGGGVDRCDFGFVVGGGDFFRIRIFLVAGRRAAGFIKDSRLLGRFLFFLWRFFRLFSRIMRRSASGRFSFGFNIVLSLSDIGGGRGFTSISGFLRFVF